ncbi:hypothetical protein N4G70_17215 [Streptomyces sp. ASQP_92]|uniref:hypothetical protein n=1 Tax=Streptomyces sp. ASQP_92 TaxID=2979116 RepID=UPI0021BFD544|nr:hypothetical protein [Streptomyces sp. ASQP_92]MCT9090582.1 hypothetical protein [Streptomyces sp. ASQP_92]
MAAIPQDLLDRIRALEREVRTLTGRANIRPALNEITNGKVKIAEGGSLEVYSPSGVGLFGVGQFGPFYNHPDGTPQQGIAMQREDGTTAFTIRANPTAQTGGAMTQAISLWDRNGHIVIGDDTTSGRGIGSPALPLPFQRLNTDIVITSSSFVGCWFAGVQAHNPVASIQLEFGAGGGSTCEVQVQYRLSSEANWSNMGTGSVTAPANDVAWKSQWWSFPLDRADFEQLVYFRVQARQKSGTSGVICNCLGGFTRRTYGPNETPDPPATTLAARAFAAEAAPEVGPGYGLDYPFQPPPHEPAAGQFEREPTAPDTKPAEPGLRTLDE